MTRLDHPLKAIFDPKVQYGSRGITAQIGRPHRFRSIGIASEVDTAPPITAIMVPPPPTVLTRVGTPFTSIAIPYYGDYDLATQHLIVSDIGNFAYVIVDCSTNNPSQLSATFIVQGWWQSCWGPTSATAFALAQSNSNNSFDKLFPVNTSNHSSPSTGTGLATLNVINFFRHGTRLFGYDFSNTLFRYTTSGTSTPVQTGSLASGGGNGCGDPNDVDVIYIPQGASVKSMDVSGANPTVIQTLTPGGSFDAGACQAVGDKLYCVGTDKFHIIDITNPASMSVLGTATDTHFAGVNLTVEPNGYYAYTVNGPDGAGAYVHAVDCRNPAAPVVAATLHSSTGMANPMDIFYDSVVGDRLVMITQEPTIQIVSITR